MALELWTDSYPIVFDGLVLEAFSTTGYRWHVAQLESITVESGRKGVQLLSIRAGRHGGISSAILPEPSVPLVPQLVAAINKVRAERYRLGPIAG